MSGAGIYVYTRVQERYNTHEHEDYFPKMAFVHFDQMDWSEWLSTYSGVRPHGKPEFLGICLSDIKYQAREIDIGGWLYREVQLDKAYSWTDHKHLVIIATTVLAATREMEDLVRNGSKGLELYSELLGVPPLDDEINDWELSF